MADDLKHDESSHANLAVEPAIGRERPLAGIHGAPWILVALLTAAFAWFAWQAWFDEDEGDVVASAMLAFEKQNALTVFSSRFEVVAESVSTPSVGPFPVEALQSRQAMIVPASVEYRIDLSGMERDDFAWDAETQVLDVTIPTLRISRPNLDEADARFFTEGVWVSRDASQSLSTSNSRIAERRAVEFARNPEILGLAREAARQAITQNLAIPLQIAGYENAQVEVRFEGEEAS